MFNFISISFIFTTNIPFLNYNDSMHLMHPVESAAVLGWRAWIVVWERRRSIGINNFFFLCRLGAVGVVNLHATEVAVIGTLQAHVVQHALVVNALSVAAAKIKFQFESSFYKILHFLTVCSSSRHCSYPNNSRIE